jgi:hypothetical protein
MSEEQKPPSGAADGKRKPSKREKRRGFNLPPVRKPGPRKPKISQQKEWPDQQQGELPEQH